MAATRTAPSLADAHVSGLTLVGIHTMRFGDYVCGLDPAAVDARIPGSEWTVGQTIGHLRAVYLRYTSDGRRAASPVEVAVQNAADELALRPADVAAAVETMQQQVEALRNIVPHVPPDRTFPFHAGQEITMAGGWGNLIGELLAHGDDIARATGTTFEIPSPDTEILWRFAAPVLRGWVRPEAAGFTDTWELRFPFGPIQLHFDAGQLTWNASPAQPPDHVIEIPDAAAFALVFPYRRRPPVDAATRALTERFFLL